MNAPACLVATWFGPAFADLHPMIQQLHRDGGTLRGPVQIEFGSGSAGWIGRRLARRLGVPTTTGAAMLEVSIFSNADGLHWQRRFNGGTRFDSLFVPVGQYPSGHWIESSGRLRLKLQVAVRAGGWHWLQRGAWLGPLAIPNFLLGTTTAGKQIVDGQYRFCVAIALPLLGNVLSYAGSLALQPVNAAR